ncbi:transglutaminase [Flavobacterium faecale]|uniref:Transglutaminase n=1 Tax=Flavobacterium faecale TaxID=1355330 RepID=A0A2S1LJA3_9FLAO|nr:DUF3857 domain-containing protein [Flavobacterium faecale]AWG23586.1 transglutaminase [Flavobacterium faecale]
MKVKSMLFILILWIITTKATAQNFELGKVSVAELQEKVHPKDTSAVVAILFEKGTNNFVYDNTKGFRVVFNVKARIKIYKKEGFDWATKKILYYANKDYNESIKVDNAVTYNLVGGKIEKVKLKSEGEFDEDINKYWKQKKITMPNIKEGSVIEFEYNLVTARYASLRDWYFQTTIPVNYSEYTNAVPEYFIYNSNLKGFVAPKVTKTVKSNYLNLSIKVQDNFLTQGGAGVQRSWSSSQATKKVEEKVEFVENVNNYIALNVPALREEAYVNNIDNYTSSISQELTMTKFPNAQIKAYATDWDDVVKTIYSLDDFGLELNKTGYFENDLAVALQGKVAAQERIEAVLHFAKSAVKWNGIYGYSCMNGVRSAYKDKTGNIADINLMLIAMLRNAGFNAEPVLVSTRSNGISFYANLNAYNYVVAAIEEVDKIILLDASDPFTAPNILPFRALNWNGRLIRKDISSASVNLMPTVPSGDTVLLNYAINDQGEITGQGRRQRTNYNAMLFRNEVKDSKEESYLEKLENNQRIDIKEYTRANEGKLKEPVMETFSFTSNQFTEIIGGEMYINPLLYLAQKTNIFKQESRAFPVDYGFPFIEKYYISIQIPAGYKVEKFPETSTMVFMEDLAVFNFVTNVTDSGLQVTVTHQINEAIIPSEDYVNLKGFYQMMTDKQNEKIVLSKI